jgi:hypothetical protein
VNMIDHQGVSPDQNAVFRGVFAEKFQIGESIFLIKEDISSAVAAMRDVMRRTGDNDSCASSHG